MLYFKFFNNLKHDVEKYGQYARIGLSQKELSWSTAKEMGMLFFLPNIMAVMHTSMALTALNNLGNGNFSILMPVLQVLAGTLLIQTIYFVFMHKRYSTQLKRALKDV
jgi:putative ABC transport system permease protein